LAVKRQNHSSTSRPFLAENGNWYKNDPAQPGVCIPVSFAERVKEAKQYPPFVEYAKRHNMTPEQYQEILDKNAKACLEKQRTSELPFPLPDKYKNDGDSRLAGDALVAVCEYRLLIKRFGPNRDEDQDQLKRATDVALGIRLSWSREWGLELAEVPLAKDFKCPTDEDFAPLEQWFLTAANAIRKEVAISEAKIGGSKAEPEKDDHLAKEKKGPAAALRSIARWFGSFLKTVYALTVEKGAKGITDSLTRRH
jgi:hypothetical protein